MGKLILMLILIISSISSPVNTTPEFQFVDITTKEAIEILEKEDAAILFFSGDTCPWCQAAEPILEKSAKDNKIDKIYRCDPRDERDNIPENKKGTEEYYKLLEILDSYLDDYTDSNGVSYGVKRIYIPDVYTIINGKIIEHHLGTLDSHSTPENFSDEQQKELYDIYDNMFKKFKEVREKDVD